MDRLFIFKVLLNFSLILALSPLVRASISIKNDTINLPYNDQRQDNKKDKKPKKTDNKQKPKQPDIRKVPKARKQTRPPVVIKPKIKVKPKIVRPKIKRP